MLSIPTGEAALWDAGLPPVPEGMDRKRCPCLPGPERRNLADFTEYERMAGEYRARGIYPGATSWSSCGRFESGRTAHGGG